MDAYLASEELHVETEGEIIDLTSAGNGCWRHPRLNLTTSVTELENGVVIAPTLENTGEDDLHVRSTDIIRVVLPQHQLRFLRFGLNMPGETVRFGTVDRSGVSPPPLPRDNSACAETDTHHIITSNSLLAYASMDREKVTIIGNGTFEVSEGKAELSCSKADGTMVLVYRALLDGVLMEGGCRKRLDPVVVLTGGDLNDLLEQWAEYAAAQTAPRIPATIPTGWNDWQYYRNEKTQEDVLDNAEVLSELRRQGYPLDFVQVDGGFCMHLSEWGLPRPSFSDGIQSLSSRVTGMGLRFGLWLAPYIQNVQTAVVRDHPKWLLVDDRGDAITLPGSNVGPSRLIDYSAEGALEWLRELVAMFVRDWGVTWIKLDGPNYAFYRRGELRDPSLTVTQMLARSFDTIRAAAGPHVLVEGEGMMGLALGRADLHRVQADNHPKWYADHRRDNPYAPLVYGKELVMAFLHNRWWCNHRENVILRNNPSPLVAAQVHGEGGVEQLFTEPEFRTQLTAAVLGSGGLLLTDPMRDLQRDGERMAWVSRLLPVYPRAARIVDAFPDQRFPAMYRLQVDDDFAVLGVCNWSDEVRDFGLPLDDDGEYLAFSFFDRRCLGVVSGCVDVTGVTAHDSRLIALRRRTGEPQLLSTDLHLLQGAVDIDFCAYRDGVLSLVVTHFRQDDNRLYLAAAGRRIASVSSNAVRWSVDDFDPEYPVLRFSGGGGNTSFEITWS